MWIFWEKCRNCININHPMRPMNSRILKAFPERVSCWIHLQIYSKVLRAECLKKPIRQQNRSCWNQRMEKFLSGELVRTFPWVQAAKIKRLHGNLSNSALVRNNLSSKMQTVILTTEISLPMAVYWTKKTHGSLLRINWKMMTTQQKNGKHTMKKFLQKLFGIYS